jgi:hypothetical protein
MTILMPYFFFLSIKENLKDIKKATKNRSFVFEKIKNPGFDFKQIEITFYLINLY